MSSTTSTPVGTTDDQFSEIELNGLPEPVRRYFRTAIATTSSTSGATPHHAVEIHH